MSLAIDVVRTEKIIKSFIKQRIIDSVTNTTLDGKLAIVLFYIPKKRLVQTSRRLNLYLAQRAYQSVMIFDRLIVS